MQLEAVEIERSKTVRETRTVDRTVKDLQSQIERKDKQAIQLTEDTQRLRDKVDKLLETIDELQASESSNQLSARRSERELREEKEKVLRLERELEGWRLRVEKGSSVGLGSVRSRTGGVASWRAMGGGLMGPDEVSEPEIPKRKSSLGRAPSLSKGFL